MRYSIHKIEATVINVNYELRLKINMCEMTLRI